MPNNSVDERFARMFEAMREVKAVFGPAEHPAVAMYEDAPCYPIEELVELSRLGNEISFCRDAARRDELIAAFVARRDSLQKKPDAPERIYLWPEGKIPTLSDYTDNHEYLYNHDPDFKPYMFELLVPAEVTPKGAVLVCAGGDHGSCTLYEGYQVCLDMNAMGYQAFLLNNRPNHNPWKPQECGVDASRALRYIRSRAEAYRIDPKNVAFAGFSNGGVTGEACIRYFSGEQTVAGHFPGYEPDELDAYYGAPDAFLCVYGPRFADADFDYTGVVYPPTFFAVGRKDTAMDNLHPTYYDLVAHGVPVEVHTFAGTPHGKAGAKLIDGEVKHPNFELWLPLADAFMQDVYHPVEIALPF